jgi:hypothetical protein
MESAEQPKQNIKDLVKHPLGTHEPDPERAKALALIPKVKELEKAKIAAGHKWMLLEKTAVLVGPQRVNHYLKQGYKFI